MEPSSRPAVLVANNTFRDNTAGEGGGIRFCYFTGALPPPIVLANTVDGNRATSGGGVSCYAASATLQQTTIEGNSASGMGGGCLVYSGQLTLENSIVSRSGSGGGLYVGAGGTITTSYCDVWNNAGGDYIHCSPAPSDLSRDPEYCEVAAHDYRLYEFSGCNGSGQGGNDIGAHGVGCFTVAGVYFYDNFSDQNDDGWVVNTQGVAGMIVASGCYAGEASGGGAFARSLVMDPTPILGDYRYRVRLEAGVIEPGGWVDLFFRYEDPGRHYRVRFDSRAGELWKESAAGASLLAGFACELPAGAWRDLEVAAVGGHLEGFLLDPDGRDHLLFSYADTEDPILTGTIGVGVEAETGRSAARFDNTLVWSAAAASVPDESAPGASRLRLVASPNPSRTATAFMLDVPLRGRVRLAIYDVRGALVSRLFEAERAAGCYQIPWDGLDERDRPVPSGVYIGRVEAGTDNAATKLLILR